MALHNLFGLKSKYHELVNRHDLKHARNKYQVTDNKLDYAQHQLSDADASALKHAIQRLPELTEINLRRNYLRQSFATPWKAIAQLNHLQVLLLGGNQLDDLGDLPAWLMRNTTLLELDLSATFLTRAALKDLYKALPFNRTLIHLNLSDVWLNRTGVGKHLVRRFNALHLKSLNLSGGFCGVDADFKSDILEALASNTVLEKIVLRNIQLEDTEFNKLIHALYNNKTLKSIDLSHNVFTDEQLTLLLAALDNNPSLRELKLSNCAISDEGIGYICAFLMHSELTSLSLSANSITRDSVGPLAYVLQTHPTLEKLELNGNNLGDSILGLCAIIKHNKKITSLSINVHDMRLEYIQAIAGLIPNQLVELRLCNALTPEMTQVLCTAVNTSTSMEKLYLHATKLNSESVAHIAHMICQNNKLRLLSMPSKHHYTEQDYALIASAMSQNHHLLDLRLWENKFDCLYPKHLEEISIALQSNRALLALSPLRNARTLLYRTRLIDDSDFEIYDLPPELHEKIAGYMAPRQDSSKAFIDFAKSPESLPQRTESKHHFFQRIADHVLEANNATKYNRIRS